MKRTSFRKPMIIVLVIICWISIDINAQSKPFLAKPTNFVSPYYPKQVIFGVTQSYTESFLFSGSLSYSPIKNIGISTTGSLNSYHKSGTVSIGYYLSDRVVSDSIVYNKGSQIELYGGLEFSKFTLSGLDFRFTDYYIMLGLHKTTGLIGFSVIPRIILSDVKRIDIYDDKSHIVFNDEVQKGDPFIYSELNLKLRISREYMGAFIQYSRLMTKDSPLFSNSGLFSLGAQIDIGRWYRSYILD